MRASTMLCAAVVLISSAPAMQAQDGLQEFSAPLSGIPDAKRKPAARAAVQKAMLEAMQRGRLKAANYELSKLMHFEALAKRRRRTDQAKRLQARIRDQRATIRSIAKAR